MGEHCTVPTVDVRSGSRRLWYDVATDEWVLEFGDAGNTVVRHQDKSAIERCLDYADHREIQPAPAQGR